jgi:hypothetical protein
LKSEIQRAAGPSKPPPALDAPAAVRKFASKAFCQSRLIGSVDRRSEASRCLAKSKRSGHGRPLAGGAGSSVCRMHGAAGGPPRGNRNAWKHGTHSAESLALKREIQALARMARETMAAIE